MSKLTSSHNITKSGLTLLQVNPDFTVQLDETTSDYGWLYIKNADDNWITKRRLSARELRVAAAQAASNRILQGLQSPGHSS